MAGPFLSIVDPQGHPIPVASLSADYEAATTGRRLSGWGLSSSGPNDSLFGSLQNLRSRSRQMVRNNANAAGAVDSFVANMVGAGIMPRWQVKDNPDLKEEIQELWNDSVPELDADGIQDAYGQQAMVARAVMESGEALVRFIPRRRSQGLAVPLQTQVLEADHLDAAYNDTLPNGHAVRMGIEFNHSGRRVAYHLFKDHPGESFTSTGHAYMDRIRVPADQILHIGRPLRPGQIRFRPWLTPTILDLYEIEQCDDAELVRRKTTAMFGGFFTSPVEEDANHPLMGGRKIGAANGVNVVAYEPGTFVGLPPGYDVNFAEPKDVSGSYIAWMKHHLRKVARGIGITYEQLTGDLEGVNYSSIRAGLLEFRRLCRMLQRHMLVHQYCRPVALRWLTAAILAGVLKIDDYVGNRRKYHRIDWRPEAWQWVDPEKEGKSEVIAVRAGFKSRAQVVAEGGRDVETVDAEIEADNRRADENGFVFDSDARKTAKTGVYQETVTDDEP